MEFGWNLAAVMAGLLIFGVGYNALVAWLEREGHAEGYVALLVVVGTLVTLAGAMALVGMEAVVQVGLCFVASGIPMIVGSCARHVKERQATLEEVKWIINKRGGRNANGKKARGLYRSSRIGPGNTGE